MAASNERTRLLPTNEENNNTAKKAFLMILLAKLLESIAFLSIKLSLIFYLTKEPLCWHNRRATVAVLILSIFTYSMGLFTSVASLKFKCFSRSCTIICIGYMLYITGYLYLPVLSSYTKDSEIEFNKKPTPEGTPCHSTWSPPRFCTLVPAQPDCDIFTHLSLVIMGMGAGLLQTNLPLFGSDQIKHGELRFLRWFAPLFYFVRNVGSFFAVSITYLQLHNFFSGFLLSFLLLLTSFICFLIGLRYYGSLHSYNIEESQNLSTNTNGSGDDDGSGDNDDSGNDHDSGDDDDSGNDDDDSGDDDNSGTDDAILIHSRVLSKETVMVLFMTLCYWICYSQMSFTGFLLQGLHLRLDFTDGNQIEDMHEIRCSIERDAIFTLQSQVCPVNRSNYENPNDATKIPPALLASANSIAVVIFLPIIHKTYHHLSDHNLIKKAWFRLWLGMFMATLSLVAAGTLEFFRLKNIYHCGYHRHMIANTVYEVSPDVTIWWQIPQYFLLGTSEVLFIVTGIQYTTSMLANKNGIVTGLFWFAAALGNTIGALLPFIFSNVWVNPTYINCNRYDSLYFGLAAFLLIISTIFLCMSLSRRANLRLDRNVIPSNTPSS